ncbi:MAG: hypothetical protein HDS92_04190 [Bacteroidales bacterium]|nr:hypothetical protein [Bacteroidales bacterium]
MCNAATKLILSSLTALCLASCGGDKTSDAARQLYESASATLERGNAAEALAMLDTLDSRYPSATDVRRQAMHIRARAQERTIVDRLAQTDSLIAALTLENETLSGSLQRVPNAVEPYIIASGSTLPATGIQARLSPDGVAYVVSSLTGHNVRHRSLTATADGGSATTASVPNDGERSVWSQGRETVHFVGAECDSLLRFIAEATGPVTITWNGASSFSRQLTPKEQNGLAIIARYAKVSTDLKVAAYEHEKLEKQLAVARSQAARTYQEEKAEKSEK